VSALAAIVCFPILLLVRGQRWSFWLHRDGELTPDNERDLVECLQVVMSYTGFSSCMKSVVLLVQIFLAFRSRDTVHC